MILLRVLLFVLRYIHFLSCTLILLLTLGPSAASTNRPFGRTSACRKRNQESACSNATDTCANGNNGSTRGNGRIDCFSCAPTPWGTSSDDAGWLTNNSLPDGASLQSARSCRSNFPRRTSLTAIGSSRYSVDSHFTKRTFGQSSARRELPLAGTFPLNMLGHTHVGYVTICITDCPHRPGQIHKNGIHQATPYVLKYTSKYTKHMIAENEGQRCYSRRAARPLASSRCATESVRLPCPLQ